GFAEDDEIRELFADVDDPDHHYIDSTLERDPTRTVEEAQVELYRRLRPGDPPTKDNASSLLEGLFFNSRRYDLARVGRYKLNKRLGLDIGLDTRTLTREDLIAIVRTLIHVNNGEDMSDDIDHLGNRRIRSVGELIQMHVRTGLQRLERGIRERMTIQDIETVTPNGLISTTRPVMAAVREFFGGSQLSQGMDQTNPLAELTHKRRLSALGPGGLSRDRAGFDVRDVHPSHYGRVCPIETPEGPNIGLIGSLATYSMPNAYGFMETPYRKVIKLVGTHDPDLAGHTLDESVADESTGEVLINKGEKPSASALATLRGAPSRQVRVKPVVSEDVLYLTADEEEQYVVAQANVPLTPDGHFVSERITARHGDKFVEEIAQHVDFMDVSPRQIVSVATAMIPFLEHDDANRALMGSNMQRQAVALISPQAPIVGTGMEWQSARDSGQVVVSEGDGIVVSATGRQVVVRNDAGEDMPYELRKFARSNQGTCINQRPSVVRG